MGCGASSDGRSATTDPATATAPDTTVTPIDPLVSGSKNGTRAISPQENASPRKPVTLADDSPPSSPGLQPRNVTATSPTERATPARSPQSGVPAETDSTRRRKSTAGGTPAATPQKGAKNAAATTEKNSTAKKKKRSADDDDEDEETAALRQEIMRQTEELAEDDTPLVNKKSKSSSKDKEKEKKLTPAEQKILEKQEKEARKKKEKEEKAAEKEAAKKEKTKRRAPPTTTSEPPTEKFFSDSDREEKTTETQFSPRKEKRGDPNTATTPSHSQQQAPFQDKYSNVNATSPSHAIPLSANVWSADNEPPPVPVFSPANVVTATTGGTTFTSWNSTARGARVNVVAAPAPVAALPLPSFQTNFDPEKFRRAQLDLAAKKEAYAHAQEDARDSRMNTQRSTVTQSSVAVSVANTWRSSSAATDSNSTARFDSGAAVSTGRTDGEKKIFSHEDEALLDDLLNE